MTPRSVLRRSVHALAAAIIGFGVASSIYELATIALWGEALDAGSMTLWGGAGYLLGAMLLFTALALRGDHRVEEGCRTPREMFAGVGMGVLWFLMLWAILGLCPEAPFGVWEGWQLIPGVLGLFAATYGLAGGISVLAYGGLQRLPGVLGLSDGERGNGS